MSIPYFVTRPPPSFQNNTTIYGRTIIGEASSSSGWLTSAWASFCLEREEELGEPGALCTQPGWVRTPRNGWQAKGAGTNRQRERELEPLSI